MNKAIKKHTYFNRELSWIEFNVRVMKEACRKEYPLLERFKFLSITSSNFDEFFMIRVAGIKRSVIKSTPYSCPSGISAPELLNKISKKTHQIVKDQYELLNKEIIPGLSDEGLEICEIIDLSKEDIVYVNSYFQSQVFPVLSPLKAVSNKAAHNFGNLQLYTGFILEGNGEQEFAVVPVPGSLARLCPLPTKDKGRKRFILLGDVVKLNANYLFPGYKIIEHGNFRLTKDMDLAVDEDDDTDFLRAMREVLIHREKSFPVRLEIDKNAKLIKQKLVDLLELEDEEVYEIDGLVDLKSLFSLCFIPGFDNLKIKPWNPCVPKDMIDSTDVFASVRQKDIILHHPYESFDPVVEMLEKAAVDPNVLSIKMTLYRTSGNKSPIVNALLQAALNKKQVVVLVELKARFDEGQNIVWAQKLEEVGATVIYGVADLKVHCKFMMIIRKEEDAVRRYLHLGTGNYNEKTAEIYGDMGILTCRDDITYEACLFFNAITGYSIIPHLSYLVMAPTMLKPKLLDLIEREISISEQGGNGHIMCKTNAVADLDIIKALYRASKAGVKVQLNVRGICMLVPGVPGQSENIEVVSVIGRYLEHTRIYYFRNSGMEEVFLASADLMTRNLDKRIELMFPVLDESNAERTKEILETYFKDTLQSHKLLPSGKYEKVTAKASINSQEVFYKEAKSYSKNIMSERGELKVRKKG